MKTTNFAEPFHLIDHGEEREAEESNIHLQGHMLYIVSHALHYTTDI